MIFKLFRRNEPEPFALYGAIVAQARQPTFYTSFSVPDTLDGRFDMVVLHIVLVCRRLRGPGGADETGSQALFDLFMRDMDRSLREMGVGDTAVPKRIKKMVAAFYGRLSAYVAALDSGDLDGLASAIGRNIFPEAERAGDPRRSPPTPPRRRARSRRPTTRRSPTDASPSPRSIPSYPARSRGEPHVHT